ncbi:hypothetical protein FNF28_00151 [Cafeteria roenbergensis]|uniref:RING-type E3 ubiquitin transferase n=1 Tax=Cafeteria roenbergensis TaxID=33653 RepID=A0A5A8E458_CAFRO|nr:hypothetical protein FNF28_00151 [Cafeteria roenbergensis]
MHKAHKATPYEEAFARLSSVALQRKPRPLPEGREVTIQLGKLDDELRCPICRDVLKHTHVVMQCMHRFCRRCIERAVRASHCCPFCRESIPSRRSTRPDKAFDGLIGMLYPDLDVYEAEEERRLEDFSRSFSANAAAIATSVPGRLNRVKITLPTVTVATLEQHVLDRTCAALPAGLVKELFAGKRPIVCFFEPVEGGVLVSALPSLGARRIGEACGIQSRELESDIPTIGCRFCLASEVERLPRAATARMA